MKSEEDYPQVVEARIIVKKILKKIPPHTAELVENDLVCALSFLSGQIIGLNSRLVEAHNKNTELKSEKSDWLEKEHRSIALVKRAFELSKHGTPEMPVGLKLGALDAAYLSNTLYAALQALGVKNPLEKK